MEQVACILLTFSQMKSNVWDKVCTASVKFFFSRLVTMKRLQNKASGRLCVLSADISPQGICRAGQVALLLPDSQLVFQGQALLVIPAIQAQLPGAQYSRSQGQGPGLV